MRIVPLSPPFGHNAKVLVDSTAFFLVMQEILAHGFMAHGKTEKRLYGIRNLIRAVIELDQVQDNGPLDLGEVGATPIAFTTRCSLAMGYWSGVIAGTPSIGG